MTNMRSTVTSPAQRGKVAVSAAGGGRHGALTNVAPLGRFAHASSTVTACSAEKNPAQPFAAWVGSATKWRRYGSPGWSTASEASGAQPWVTGLQESETPKG